jgi:hypothetical protein
MASLFILLLLGLVMIANGGLNNRKYDERYPRYGYHDPYSPYGHPYQEHYHRSPYYHGYHSPRRGQNLGTGCFMLVILLVGVLLAVITRGGG